MTALARSCSPELSAGLRYHGTSARHSGSCPGCHSPWTTLLEPASALTIFNFFF